MEKLSLSDEQLSLLVEFIKRKYSKPAYALLVNTEQIPTPLGSRLGGIPYWDFSKEYPVDNQGGPLRFFGQINLDDFAQADVLYGQAALENKATLPKQGLLQFFMAVDDGMGYDYYTNSNLLKAHESINHVNTTYQVIYHEQSVLATNITWEELEQQFVAKGLDKHQVSNFELSTDDWAILGECALAVKSFLDVPHIGDDQLFTVVLKDALKEELGINQEAVANWFLMIDDDTSRRLLLKLDACSGLNEQEIALKCGHFLGYPDFCQANPFESATDICKQHYNTLLCLFDYAEAQELQSSLGTSNFEMLWGDSGIANFFINQERLAQKDFSDVFYTWDCY